MQAALLLALIAVLLSPALKADFLWDDFNQIVESPTIGDLSNIPFYFTHNVVQSAGSEGRGAPGVDLYRPLFMISLTAIHAVNGPDPFWFHLAVLAAHLLVCALLWALVLRWLGSGTAATLALLFFACHPVTAEAYLWPSAISEPLAAAGLLGAVLVLDRGCRQGGPGARRPWTAAVAASMIFFGGLLSKEAVLMALPAVSLYLSVVRDVRARYLMPSWLAAMIFLVMRTVALAGLQAGGADGAPTRIAQDDGSMMRGKGKQIALLTVVMGVIFNLGNTYINGRWLFYFSPEYTTEWLSDPRFIIGILMFITGFVICKNSDHILQNLRKPRLYPHSSSRSVH